MRVIAVMSQKGGVGKTTTSLNLAHALALAGQQVTVLDMDPQAHLTTAFGIAADQPGMDQVLLKHAEIENHRVTVRDNLMLVPAGQHLGDIERVNKGGVSRGLRLREAIKKMKQDQDFVLIDCPPSGGLLVMNILLGVKELLIPVSADFLSLQALSRLLGTVRHIEQSMNHKLKRYLVVTRYYARRRLATEVRHKLSRYFPQQLMATSIRENVALAESPSFGQSIFEYRSKSHGAEDYRALADELMQRAA